MTTELVRTDRLTLHDEQVYTGDRLIHNRTYYKQGTFGRKGARIGTLNLSTLPTPEAVRDALKKVRELQDPKDFEFVFATSPVSFVGGPVQFTKLGSKKEDPARHYRMTKTAFQQASREVVGARQGTFLLETAKLHKAGEQMATTVWGAWALTEELRKRQFLARTVNMRIEGQSVKVLRAVLSQGFPTYDNTEFMEAVTSSEAFKDYRLIQALVSDDFLRLRFIKANDLGDALRKQVPMFELWNSETGRRRVFMRVGTFTLACTNGLHHWSTNAEYSWYHRGNMDRIRNGVATALEQLSPYAETIRTAYERAMQVTSNDMLSWLDEQLKELGASAGFRGEVANVLVNGDPTIVEGQSLASAVDGVTLIAQQLDMEDQFEAERMAGVLLSRGVNEAGTRNRIIVEV